MTNLAPVGMERKIPDDSQDTVKSNHGYMWIFVDPESYCKNKFDPKASEYGVVVREEHDNFGKWELHVSNNHHELH